MLVGKRCPVCHSNRDAEVIGTFSELEKKSFFYVKCPACGYSTDKYQSKEEAVKSWAEMSDYIGSSNFLWMLICIIKDRQYIVGAFDSMKEISAMRSKVFGGLILNNMADPTDIRFRTVRVIKPEKEYKAFSLSYIGVEK